MKRKLLLYSLCLAAAATLIYIYLSVSFTYSNKVSSNWVGSAKYDPYIAEIKKIHTHKFRYLGDRNRMPLYTYFQETFYSKGQNDDSFLTIAKSVNILLSLILTISIFIVCSRLLTVSANITFTLITAFALFLPKSASLQPEILYYTLSFFSFLTFCFALKKPSVKIALFAGALASIAYLTKATMLLGFVIFVSSIASLLVINTVGKHVKLASNHKSPRLKLKTLTITLVIALVTFVGILSPYLIQNKKVYGSYIFNYATTYDVWYDDLDQLINDTKGLEIPDLYKGRDKAQIPSLQNYAKNHDIGVIFGKMLYGGIVHYAFLTSTYAGIPSVMVLVCFTLLIYLIFLTKHNRKTFISTLSRNKHLVIFISLYFLIYTTSFVWYSLIGSGPRFVLSLFIPALFVVFWLIDRLAISNKWIYYCIPLLLLTIVLIKTIPFFSYGWSES